MKEEREADIMVDDDNVIKRSTLKRVELRAAKPYRDLQSGEKSPNSLESPDESSSSLSSSKKGKI